MIPVHRTFTNKLAAIYKAGGLSRMDDNYIHFADDDKMECGHDIIIYLDLPKAIAAGYKFHLSENNMLLCPGNSAGLLPLTYLRIEKVV